MTREIADVIRDATNRPHPVVNLEDGVVWVSGMNSRPWVLARRIREALQDAGYDAGAALGDGAALHGGLELPVPECEDIPDDVHQEVFE